MTLKSDLSKFCYIVSFEPLFGMTSKLTRIFTAVLLLVPGKMCDTQWALSECQLSNWSRIGF